MFPDELNTGGARRRRGPPLAPATAVALAALALGLDVHAAEPAPPDAPRVEYRSAFAGYAAYAPDVAARAWRDANAAASRGGHALSDAVDAHRDHRP